MTLAPGREQQCSRDTGIQARSGKEAAVKGESRTSLDSLVTKDGLEIQHFRGNNVQNTAAEEV